MDTHTPRTGAASLLVIGLDPSDMGLIRDCIGSQASVPERSIGFTDALQQATQQRPQVIVVGFDGDFDAAVRLGSSLKAELPQVQLVAHSRSANPERIRAAMRAGFREYVVLPEDGALLRRAIQEAPSEVTSTSDQGQVIAVIGAKGGCGTTFISVNLAAELCPVHRVCVADMDFSMGDVANTLDLQPSSHMGDLLANLSRLDERMLAGSVAVHPSGLHILAQPMALSEANSVRADDVLRVLSCAADAYQYVLADCGGRLDAATRTVSLAADLVILVCTPDVPSVRNAWRRLQLLQRQGVDLHKIRLVLNRWDGGRSVSIEEIERNLGIPVAGTVADDPKAALAAVNEQVLLRDMAPRSAATTGIADLVSLITDGAQRVLPTSTSSRLGWLFS
jgi:pilus assembly protein CpaE